MGLQTLRPSISGRQTGMVFLWAMMEALLIYLELLAERQSPLSTEEKQNESARQ